MPPSRSEDQWVRHCATLSTQSNDALENALAAGLIEHPRSARLLFNLGVLQAKQHKAREARLSWSALLEIQPGHSKAHKGLAQLALAELDGPLARHHASNALAGLGQAQTTMTLDVLCLLGKSLIVAGDWDDALVAFGHARQVAQALNVASEDALMGWHFSGLLCSRGSFSTQDLSGWKNACWIRQANAGLRDDSPEWRLDADSDIEIQALSLIADTGLIRLRACDWRERDTVILAMARLAQGVRSRPTLGLPRPAAFEALHLNMPPQALQWLARGTSNLIRLQQQSTALWRPTDIRRHNGPMRLGYLSNDFGRHPTSQLIHRILAHHDKDRFVVHAYALNKDDDSQLRQSIAGSVAHFEECFGLDVEAIARKIHENQIDVLVGLGGHTAGRVMDIAMWRPAPVQINYLSFCGTTGAADAFDIHIADPVSTPPELARFYDERVEYLPNGHYAYDDSRVIGPTPARSELGLPDDKIILCGFNNSYKIEPGVFDAWCSILNAVPESVLWLFQWHRDQPDNLWAEATKRGVSTDRIIFAQPISGENYLDRLGCADLFLDTFTYNGHTSMLDVLYAGVPAVTRRGPTSPGRIASAFLHEAGLGDWIAESTADYIDKVVTLASKPTIRVKISAHLKDLRVRKAAPFGAAHRCKELEALYARLHHEQQASVIGHL